MRKQNPQQSPTNDTSLAYNQLDTTNGEDNIFSLKNNETNYNTVNQSRNVDNINNGSVSGLDLAGLGLG